MYSLPGSIKMLLLQKDCSTNIMHQADRQLDNGKVQTDRRQPGRQAGRQGGCQAEYSYKFNEHPDSREFVTPARSSLCTQTLTG